MIAQGTIDDLARSRQSLTGAYLAGKRVIAIPAERKVPDGRFLTIKGARHNNLKEIDVVISAGAFYLCDGCFRLGQELAGGRHPSRGAARELERGRRPSRARTSGSRGSSISTR